MVVRARSLLLALALAGCSDGEGSTGSTTTGQMAQTGIMCIDFPGVMMCDGDCVDVFSDPSNCGSCGVQCGQSSPCLDGVCEATCADGGGTLCGAFCVQLDEDASNCGSCDNACGPMQLCSSGECVDVGSSSSGSSGSGTGSTGDSTGTGSSTGASSSSGTGASTSGSSTG